MSAHEASEGAHACPGCAWRDVPREEERARKTEALRAAIARHPDLGAPEIHELPEIGPLEGYRTRAKLQVGAGGALGLFAEGTHDVVDAPACPLLVPAIAAVARAIRALLASPPAEAGAVLVASADGGALAAVDLREVIDGCLVTLALDRLPGEREVRAACEAIRARAPAIVSIAVNRRGPGPQVLGPETRVVDGSSEVRDRIDPDAPWVLASHGSFVQSHRGVARAIHETIAREIASLGAAAGGGATRVIELHAGSGALALRLASSGARVRAIESFAPAIALARRAADAQEITGLELEEADASDALARTAPGSADAIVLDPPRRGIPAELRARIAAIEPQRVLYVSCDPETLARDLAHLARLGLAIRSIAPLDMMPRTPHVEAIAILGPAPIPSARVIHEDARLIAVAKDPHEPTTPHPEHRTSTLARVRRIAGAEGAVPVHRLDAGTSGVCLFARAPEHVAPIAAALTAGKKSYLTLVRGITHGKGIVRRALRSPTPTGEGRNLRATTRFTRRAIVSGHSYLRASPEEGRLHQIRRHLASLGHPVLGDARHGHPASNRHLWERAALDRPFLHCARIELAWAEGAPLVLEAPLAPDLELVLARLRG